MCTRCVVPKPAPHTPPLTRQTHLYSNRPFAAIALRRAASANPTFRTRSTSLHAVGPAQSQGHTQCGTMSAQRYGGFCHLRPRGNTVILSRTPAHPFVVGNHTPHTGRESSEVTCVHALQLVSIACSSKGGESPDGSTFITTALPVLVCKHRMPSADSHWVGMSGHWQHARHMKGSHLVAMCVSTHKMCRGQQDAWKRGRPSPTNRECAKRHLRMSHGITTSV